MSEITLSSSIQKLRELVESNPLTASEYEEILVDLESVEENYNRAKETFNRTESKLNRLELELANINNSILAIEYRLQDSERYTSNFEPKISDIQYRMSDLEYKLDGSTDNTKKELEYINSCIDDMLTQVNSTSNNSIETL